MLRATSLCCYLPYARDFLQGRRCPGQVPWSPAQAHSEIGDAASSTGSFAFLSAASSGRFVDSYNRISLSIVALMWYRLTEGISFSCRVRPSIASRSSGSASSYFSWPRSEPRSNDCALEHPHVSGIFRDRAPRKRGCESQAIIIIPDKPRCNREHIWRPRLLTNIDNAHSRCKDR